MSATDPIKAGAQLYLDFLNAPNHVEHLSLEVFHVWQDSHPKLAHTQAMARAEQAFYSHQYKVA